MELNPSGVTRTRIRLIWVNVSEILIKRNEIYFSFFVLFLTKWVSCCLSHTKPTLTQPLSVCNLAIELLLLYVSFFRIGLREKGTDGEENHLP